MLSENEVFICTTPVEPRRGGLHEGGMGGCTEGCRLGCLGGRERGDDLVCLARALGGCVACSVCAMRGYGVESAWESVNGAIGQCV